MAEAPGVLEAMPRREAAARAAGASLAELAALWSEKARAEEALEVGPAIIYALEHDGSLDGYEPPQPQPTHEEEDAPA
jgi:hypothetical protein